MQNRHILNEVSFIKFDLIYYQIFLQFLYEATDLLNNSFVFLQF